MKGEGLWTAGKRKLKPLIAKLRRGVWMVTIVTFAQASLPLTPCGPYSHNGGSTGLVLKTKCFHRQKIPQLHLPVLFPNYLRSTSSLYASLPSPASIDPWVWEVLLTHIYDSSQNHKISGLVGAWRSNNASF